MLPLLLFISLPASVRTAHAAALRPKPVPEITFDNFSPPYKNYDYFQDHDPFPFAYDATSFSWVNAWWLAEASMLVYADEAFVRQRFGQAGFNHVRFFSRAGTQCFVAAEDRFAIVAFRGTEIWKRGTPFDADRIIADLKTDVDVRRSPWDREGTVHSGFKAALDDVWGDLQPEIAQLQAKGMRIWITGHSLGGALATLAADRLGSAQGVYTFGAPRVGDEQFRAGFECPLFRVVDGHDFIAGVPPRSPYRHVGTLVRIDPYARDRDGRASTEKNEEIPCPAGDDARAHDQDGALLDSSMLIPRSVRDHVPLLYAIGLWNELVACQQAKGASR